MLKQGGDIPVTRDQILKAIAEFDSQGLGETYRLAVRTTNGWSLDKDGQRYNPRWIIRLATQLPLSRFHYMEAINTIRALGFQVTQNAANPQGPGDEDDAGAQQVEEEAVELTFGIERDLQQALRRHIEDLEPGMKITDGGKEKIVPSGRIDITAEDAGGTAVVIELKIGEADRQAIGQILAYMGDLVSENPSVRGILVAEDFSPRAVAAARVVPRLQLIKYKFTFAFQEVSAGHATTSQLATPQT